MPKKFKSVSIITPFYNQEETLEQTIKSVLSQEGDFNLEHIIINDGSPDNGIEIIKKYELLLKNKQLPINCDHLNLKWFEQKNKGFASAVNKGIKESSGEIIGWLNSDDYFEPNTIKSIINEFNNHPEMSLIYGDCYSLYQETGHRKLLSSEPGNFEKFLRRNHSICQPAAFFTKAIIDKIGYLDEGLKCAPDYDLWLRILKNGKSLHLKKILATYRQWEKSVTVSKKNLCNNERKEVMKRHGGNIIDPKTIYALRAKVPFSSYLRSRFPKTYNLIKKLFYFFIDKLKYAEPKIADLKKKNLVLFMTSGMNFKNWEKSGLLSREIASYNLLALRFKNIFIFTYGDKSELAYQKFLKPNIKIIYKNVRMPIRLYYWFAPFLHLPTILRSHFFKTNQMRGAKTALIAKFINPFAKLIIRTGYTQSLFDTKENKNIFKIKRLEKTAYRFSNHAFVTSLADKKYLIEEYKIPENKISVIANYIDTDIFKPLNLNKYSDRLIFVGRLNEQKNLFSLIEALSGTNLSLDIVGSGKLKDKLENFAEEKNVSVNFLGIIPNNSLPETLNRYEIFILPSLYEGMPKTLLEAMSCGLACVATDVPGSREVISDNFNGLLSEISPESLREKIKELAVNAELQKKLGKNARRFVLENFSLSTQIDKEISIYKKLVRN
ncbi:MAG: glycosyltransferase [Candidatus Paceibacterota bacterium]